jgi:hypothetical protein
MALGAAPSALASRHGDVMGSRVRARVRVNAKTSVARGAAPLRVVAKDFPKPTEIDKTKNYLISKDLSDRIKVTTARRIATSHRGVAISPPHDLQLEALDVARHGSLGAATRTKDQGSPRAYVRRAERMHISCRHSRRAAAN